MSIFRRMKAVSEARVNDLANAMEDPKASLDFSLVKLEEIRGEINRSLIEVSAARGRLESQRALLAENAAKHQEQARRAVSVGREDLARLALARRAEDESRLEELDASLSSLDRQLENLKDSQAGLERKIALFQSKKEELKAIYDASKAQVRVRESLLGISADLADVGSTIQRAEARIRDMQSRAQAIDGLVADGVIHDPLESGRDDIDRELSRIGRVQIVDQELARLKAEQVELLAEKNQDQPGEA